MSDKIKKKFPGKKALTNFIHSKAVEINDAN